MPGFVLRRLFDGSFAVLPRPVRGAAARAQTTPARTQAARHAGTPTPGAARHRIAHPAPLASVFAAFLTAPTLPNAYPAPLHAARRSH